MKNLRKDNKCLLTCEQSTHHADSQTCHSEGFWQSILCAKVRQKLDCKDLRGKVHIAIIRRQETKSYILNNARAKP